MLHSYPLKQVVYPKKKIAAHLCFIYVLLLFSLSQHKASLATSSASPTTTTSSGAAATAPGSGRPKGWSSFKETKTSLLRLPKRRCHSMAEPRILASNRPATRNTISTTPFCNELKATEAETVRIIPYSILVNYERGG